MVIARFSRLGVFFALCIMGVSACGTAPGGPPQMTGTPQVTALVVEPRHLSLNTELPGRVTAKMVAQVRPQVTGLIRQRLFVEGEVVSAEQLLYQIDSAAFKAAVNRAQASVARAEASLSLAAVRAKRDTELAELKAVSQQQADESHATLKQARADVAAAKAALQAERIDLEYTAIRAPISGRIGRSSVSVGALVIANQGDALATIHQLDPVYIDVVHSSSALLEYKGTQQAERILKGGASVQVLLPDGTPYAHLGVVQFAETTIDQATDGVTLRIQIPNPQGTLLPGMYVRAQIETAAVSDAILIPQQALIRGADEQTDVALVDAEGYVSHRRIAVSRVVGDQWVVQSGLNVGDRVIVEGHFKVRPGDRVEVVEPMPLLAAQPIAQY